MMKTIAFEGLDGVGKTTVATKFAEKNNMEFRAKHLEEMLEYTDDKFLEIRDKINENTGDDSTEVRTLLFLSSLLYGRRNLGTDVVYDRNILSEYYFDGNPKTEKWFKMFIQQGYAPDLTFILYAPDDIRKKRIQERNIDDDDLKKKFNGYEGYKKMFVFAEKYNLPYYFINTKNKTIEEIVEECDKNMNEFFKENSKYTSVRKKEESYER